MALLVALAVGCQTNDNRTRHVVEPSPLMPDWVLQPPNEPGIAIYAASVNGDGDAKQALAQARENLGDKTFRLVTEAWWELGTPPQLLRTAVDRITGWAEQLEEFHFDNATTASRSAAVLVSIAADHLLSHLAREFDLSGRFREELHRALRHRQQALGEVRYIRRRNTGPIDVPPPVDDEVDAERPAQPDNPWIPPDGGGEPQPDVDREARLAHVVIVHTGDRVVREHATVPMAGADAELMESVFSGLTVTTSANEPPYSIRVHTFSGRDASNRLLAEHMTSLVWYPQPAPLLVILFTRTAPTTDGATGTVLYSDDPGDLDEIVVPLARFADAWKSPSALIVASDVPAVAQEPRDFGQPVLFAGGRHQTVLVDPLRGHGLMAWYLAKGLGDMRADANHDSEVTWSELISYLRRTVLAASQGLGGGQLPYPVGECDFRFRRKLE